MPKRCNNHSEVLTQRQRRQLELEVVSSNARLRLTRLLRAATRDRGEDPSIQLIRANAVINLANTVSNRPIYQLESDGWGVYEPAEYGWHQGELELIHRRPNTPQLIEILADLITEDWLDENLINEILEADRCSVRFSRKNGAVQVEVIDLPPLDENASVEQNPNIRQLFDRLDRAMEDQDWTLVLHTGASIFETLAKLVVPKPGVQDQSLGSFFAAFRKHSKLAVPLLDTIEAIYKRRNIEPLAGHGSIKDPNITREEAIQIANLTRALVRLERELGFVNVPPISKSTLKKPKVKAQP